MKPLPSTLSQSDLLKALGEDGFDGQIAAWHQDMVGICWDIEGVFL